MNSIHHQLFLDPKTIKRNLVIVGEQGHGKTNLFNLFCKNESMKLNLQTDQREILNNNICNQQNVLVAFENQTESFLFNIFDTSGGYENILDVENIFRIVDGFILVVDIVEGVDDYAKEILKLALLDNLQPILFISKFDEALQIFKSHIEQLYKQIYQIIIELNELISTLNFNNPDIKQFDFSQGNIIFGSSLYNWGFDVEILQVMYSAQDILNFNQFVKYLWKNDELNSLGFHGQDLIKFFTDFIINPILYMLEDIKNSNKSINNKKLQLYNSTQFNENTKEKDKAFQIKTSLCDCLYNKIIKFIPSPKYAQILRAQNFFLQSQNEIVFQSIQNCDSSGPLIVYICKFCQIKDDQVIAICKVLSGTLQENQIVQIMSSNYMHKNFDDDKGIWKFSIKKSELHEIEIKKMILLNGFEEQIQNVQCGNIIGIFGLDSLLKANGIMTDNQYEIIIKPNRLKQLNIVKVLIQPEEPHMLNQMLEAIKQQEQIDQQLYYYAEESGELVLSCCSNKHQEKTFNQLKIRLQKQNLKIKISDPLVEMRETVIDKSNFKFLAISQNRCIRLYAGGEKICDDLVNAIENKTIDVQGSAKDLALKLDIEFNWEFDEAKRIICFGPDRTGANILVNQITSNEQERVLRDVNPMMGVSFQWTTKEGVLAEENVRGLKINFYDFIYRGDQKNRVYQQIIPTARRLFSICQLTAKTRIQEPISKTSVRVSNFQIDEIFQIIQENQGVILSERQIFQSSDSIIKFYHPTSKSHILQRDIDFLTVQKGIWKEQFDCWVTLIQDPSMIGTKTYEYCQNIRRRKGLKLEIPNLEKFMDEE